MLAYVPSGDPDSERVGNPFAKDRPPTKPRVRSTYQDAISTVQSDVDWIEVTGVAPIDGDPNLYEIQINAWAGLTTDDESGKAKASIEFTGRVASGEMANVSIPLSLDKTSRYELKKVGADKDWAAEFAATVTPSLNATLTNLATGNLREDLSAALTAELKATYARENLNATVTLGLNDKLSNLSKDGIQSLDFNAGASLTLQTPQIPNVGYFQVTGTINETITGGFSIGRGTLDGGITFGIEPEDDMPKLLKFFIDHIKVRIPVNGPGGSGFFDFKHPQFMFEGSKTN